MIKTAYVLERQVGEATEYLDLDLLKWDSELDIRCLFPSRTYARKLADARRQCGEDCWVREVTMRVVGARDEI